jgi:hypothetical protein
VGSFAFGPVWSGVDEVVSLHPFMRERPSIAWSVVPDQGCSSF